MSIVLQGSTSGSITLQEPAVAGSTVLSLPARTSTILGDDGAGKVRKADMPTGSVLQVVQTIKTDTMTSTATGWNDISGLSATITPISTSSRIVAHLTVNGGGQGGTTHIQIRLLRNSTEIGSGTPDGTNTPCLFFLPVLGSSDATWSGTGIVFDSPSTTSAITYKAQFRNNNSNGTIYINRSQGNNGVNCPLTSSQLTLMEIAA